MKHGTERKRGLTGRWQRLKRRLDRIVFLPD
jgi:hypothetical protein